MIRALIFSVGSLSVCLSCFYSHSHFFRGLGYHIIGVKVVLAAILRLGGSLLVVDLISADLSSRRERIKNASRMIKICGILRSLQEVIGEGKDRDMFLVPW